MTNICPGFYVDEQGSLYLYMGELLAEWQVPDTPAVRRMVLEHLSHDFQLVVPFGA